MQHIIVLMSIRILKASFIGRCVIAVMLVLSVTHLVPVYLVELLMVRMVLLARVLTWNLLTQLLLINFHMSKINESIHEEISPHLLIPADFIHVILKMEISIEIKIDTSLPNEIILGTTGGPHSHPSLVIKNIPDQIIFWNLV